MAENDWRLSHLLSEQVKQFEQHSERVASVVDEARKRFNQDYTGYTAGFSALLIGTSLVLGAFGIASAICVTSIAVGGIGLVASLVCRQLNQRQQVKFTREVIDMERERARSAQRAAVLNDIWIHGFPEGTSLAQIQILLGESPTAGHEGSTLATWKSLPNPEEDSSNRRMH